MDLRVTTYFFTFSNQDVQLKLIKIVKLKKIEQYTILIITLQWLLEKLALNGTNKFSQ